MMYFSDSASDCEVFLTGKLSAMPVITNDWTTNASIMVTRQFSLDHELKNESYCVIINHYDTSRILQSGYVGMLISIHGELRTQKNTLIIANKITFIDPSGVNQPPALIDSFRNKKTNLTNATCVH